MLALLTRQRDMLKTERFFNTFRKYVAAVVAARFLQARTDIAANQIGF